VYKKNDWCGRPFNVNFALSKLLGLLGLFAVLSQIVTNALFASQLLQDAQLSQRGRAAVCVIVFAKSRRLELGDNILRTLYVYLQPL